MATEYTRAAGAQLGGSAQRAYEGLTQGTEAARDTRMVERGIHGAQQMLAHATMIAQNLRDIRRRLMGESDPQPGNTSNKVAEVLPEFHQLGSLMEALNLALQDIDNSARSLDRL